MTLGRFGRRKFFVRPIGKCTASKLSFHMYSFRQISNQQHPFVNILLNERPRRTPFKLTPSMNYEQPQSQLVAGIQTRLHKAIAPVTFIFPPPTVPARPNPQAFQSHFGIAQSYSTKLRNIIEIANRLLRLNPKSRPTASDARSAMREKQNRMLSLLLV